MPRLLRVLVLSCALAAGQAIGQAIGQAPGQGAPPATGATSPACAPLDDLMTSFLRDRKVPGASLAVGRNGRLLYSRGFGLADVDRQEPVQPQSLFRIASISKPVTSAAVMRLVEQGKVSLDDHPMELLGIRPALKDGRQPDDRLARITVRDLLSHAGGFDRARGRDPMFMSRRIASDLHVPSPPAPADIIRWVTARPLDFEPGTKSVYSNFGYCVLGRIIEQAGGESYEACVTRHVLHPLGITGMRLGRTLESDRAPGEVRYYSSERTGPPVFEEVAGDLPDPYGAWCLESMDAHGGWIASAPDLVRFAAALDEPGRLLTEESLAQLLARPAYADPRAPSYYALGWSVRPVGASANVWHNGSLPGTSTLLVRRHDGFVWAVLFNSREGNPAARIDPLIHKAVDSIGDWPDGEPLFIAESAAPPASEAR